MGENCLKYSPAIFGDQLWRVDCSPRILTLERKVVINELEDVCPSKVFIHVLAYNCPINRPELTDSTTSSRIGHETIGRGSTREALEDLLPSLMPIHLGLLIGKGLLDNLGPNPTNQGAENTTDVRAMCADMVLSTTYQCNSSVSS